MKTLKKIVAITMVVMIGVVFMPMVPGMNGVARAAEGNEFYAVFNTAAEGTLGQPGYKPANTLSFYYDANKATHTGETTTVYDGLPTEATVPYSWGYNDKRDSIKNVVIDDSVAGYDGLMSTAAMFAEMKNADNISGCEYLNVSNVKSMSKMFLNYASSSKSITDVPDVSEWNTDNVTAINSVFNGYASSSTAITDVPDVAEWNTATVENMTSAFASYASSSTSITDVPDVSGWDTANVTIMTMMFVNYAQNSTAITNVPDLSGWNTAKVTKTGSMFRGYASSSVNKLNPLDLSSFDTSKVTTMAKMFQNCSALKTIYVSDKFVTSGIKDPEDEESSSSNMFDGCASLVGGAGTAYVDTNPKDKTYARIDKGTSEPGYFTKGGTIGTCTWLITKSGDDTILTIKPTTGNEGTLPDGVENKNDWPWDNERTNITKVVINSGVEAGNSTAYMFNEFIILTDIEGLDKLNTSNVTNMRLMFSSCIKLTSLDLSGFDTSNVSDMRNMFAGSGYFGDMALKTIYVSDKWTVGEETMGDNMFIKCPNLVGGAGTKFDSTKADKTYARIDGGASNPGYFTGAAASITSGETTKYYATVQKAVDAATTGQTVMMITDSIENVEVASDDNLTIDLNGKTLKSPDDTECPVILNKGTLNIKDSGTNGKITGGNIISDAGGGIINHGTFNMIGGSITDNYALGGGGVSNAGTFNMIGGSISGNSATMNNGGGVENSGTFNMSGGSITDNKVVYGDGAGVNNNGNMNVSGKSIVKDNKKGTGGNAKESNVYLQSGKTITVGTGTSPVKYLESGAYIGVTTKDTPSKGNPVAITSDNAKDYRSYFYSDNDLYYINKSGLGSKQKVVLSTETPQIETLTKFIAQGKSYKKSVKYSWTPVEGATSYKVYQVRCGKKYKKVKTTSATTFTKKKLKRRTTYKAYVVAYNSAGEKIAQTPTIHNRTTGGSRSNATAVSATANATVKVGATANVGAKITKKDSKKKLLWKNHVSAPIRYYSADTAVATVDAAGNVTGVEAGIANIYSVAPSGVYAVTKVTVQKAEPPK